MSDRFKKTYLPLTEDAQRLVRRIKEMADDLDAQYSKVQGREIALAITNLEQSVMWATKAVVLDDEKNQKSKGN